jgi:hypothetical protein
LTFTAINVCPVGYTLVGSNCNLNNANSVMKPADGNCTIVRSGNSFSGDALDPDCTVTAGVSVSSSSVTVSPKVGSSQNTKVEVLADGSGKVTSSTPNSDGTTTQRTTVFGAPDPTTGSAKITGTSQATFSGTGSSLNSSPQGEPPKDPCGLPTTAPCKIDESGTPGGGGYQEAAKAALDLVTPSSLGVSAWTGSGTAPWTGLPSVPGSDSCVNPVTWVLMGNTIVPDICSIWSPLKSWLAWLLYALTALFVWKRATGALGVA